MRELPRSWNWARFGDVASIDSNLVDPANHLTLPHIAPNHIESRTGRLLPYSTIKEDGVTSGKHLFHSGHILYSKIRPYLAKAVRVDFEGLCSADMYPVSTGLDTGYLHQWLISSEFTALAAGEQGRSVLPKINQESLNKLPVPVPPLAEQARIVAVIEEHLSRLYVASSSLESAEARLNLLESRAVEDAFTSVDGRLPIGELAEVRGGIQKQPKRKPKHNRAPFLRVANVGHGQLDLGEVHEIELFEGELERHRLQAGDLLVVEGNGSATQIGRSAVWHGDIGDCVHQNHLIRVRPGPLLDAEFLGLFWNAPSTRGQLTAVASSTSGLHTLSTAKVKQIEVPVVSIVEQRAIVEELNARLGTFAHLRASLGVARARKASLNRSILAAAFSGQLVAQDPDDEPASVLLDRIGAERETATPPKRKRRSRS